MMNTEQYLLARVAEEANEVSQRALKAQLFGLDEVQPGQPYNNAARLRQEYADLYACLDALTEYSGYPVDTIQSGEPRAKREKLARFAQIAFEQGQISEDTLKDIQELAR